VDTLHRVQKSPHQGPSEHDHSEASLDQYDIRGLRRLVTSKDLAIIDLRTQLLEAARAQETELAQFAQHQQEDHDTIERLRQAVQASERQAALERSARQQEVASHERQMGEARALLSKYESR